MKVNGAPYRTIWLDADSGRVEIIDQTLLPHRFEIKALSTLEEVAEAILTMRVRGAPLIGATAAYGLALALQSDASQASEEHACQVLLATRPTAINLRWALERMQKRLVGVAPEARADRALDEAAAICDEDARTCERIGLEGLPLLEQAWQEKQQDPARRGDGRLHLLTHCNAGWLATVDWGTALAPIYKAHEAGLPVHVWVDETRPRNQGASLTAWELAHHGIDHTVIADNTGGHLMQRGQVDLCIVGSDRTTAHGDVCNKIGTYLKALAAADNGVPFYVALPVSTIDFTLGDGIAEIPIEQRDAREVSEISGLSPEGEVVSVRLTPPESPAANYAFDVTPARLVTRLITEHGVVEPRPEALEALRREHVA